MTDLSVKEARDALGRAKFRARMEHVARVRTYDTTAIPVPDENGQRGGVVNNDDVWWFYSQRSDGTFECRPYWCAPGRNTPNGNAEYFPTAFEADVYCRARTGGSSSIGGSMRVMEARLKQARDGSSVENIEPVPLSARQEIVMLRAALDLIEALADSDSSIATVACRALAT